jgi:voltage-gated potassium channel
MTVTARETRRRRDSAWRAWLRELYTGNSARAVRFRYALLVFDVLTIVYIVASSFYRGTPTLETVDYAIGLVILFDFAARLAISRHPVEDLTHPLGLADLIVVVSFLAPLAGEGFAFLRVLRMLRLLRTYRVATRLRRDFRFFRRNRDGIIAVLHLFVFLFVMTALVYELQHRTNPAIGNYADALYFTVTALTTTGFGDITLQGTGGRLLSVVIMIFGVSLFLRMAQVLFRPAKVYHRCPDCGLTRHDADAVHCKDCGRLLNIENEGEG